MERVDYETVEALEVSRKNAVMSQVIACFTLFLLLISIGTSVSIATVVIPALLNSKEGLSITESQASWFGSVAFICQPIGTIFSGSLMDYLGRKKALTVVNLPHLLGFLLLYYSWNVTSLFFANALLGLGTGIMEAPSITYIGEISEPSIRGVLTTVTTMFAPLGIFIVFFLGSVTTWRTTSIICVSVPILAMMVAYLIPETPIWLISKGREEEAVKSLCWVRGWCHRKHVDKEFRSLLNYYETTNICMLCPKETLIEHCSHKKQNFLRRFWYKVRFIFFVKETMRPLLLILAYFFCFALSGFVCMRPNLENVCRALGMSYDPKKIVLFTGILTMLMTIFVSVIMSFVGKRVIAMTSMIILFLSNVALASYAKLTLSDDVYSYNVSTFPVETSIIPTILFMFLVVGTGLAIPWVIVSEVFPFKSRGIASSMSGAGFYVVNFVGAKTHLDLEVNLHMYGTFSVYAVVSFIGFLILYTFLPETENKTLTEIEKHFSGNELIVGSAFKCFGERCKVRNYEEEYDLTKLNEDKN